MMIPANPLYPLAPAAAVLLASAAALQGCNALDDPNGSADMVRIVPTDERPALLLDMPPPPLEGGTLLVTRDGALALAADEARDRLSVIDLQSESWLGEVSFAAGSQPGRVAQGNEDMAYVVLRRAGSIAAVSLSGPSLVAEYPVCAAPRGVAFDPALAALHVACASGRFVTLSPDGQVTRSLQLPNDLRDVVIEGDSVWVSRFRSAEVLRLDAAGALVERLAPPTLVRERFDQNFASVLASFEPNTAWRLLPNPAGGVALVHQRSTTEAIALEPPSGGGSAYGSGNNACGSIQRSSVTTFRAGGRVLAGPDVPATLPVDGLIQADGLALVIGAGQSDLAAPRSSFVSHGTDIVSPGFDVFGSVGALVAVQVEDAASECGGIVPDIQQPALLGPQYVVAVAALPQRGRYVLQRRDPAELVLVSRGQPNIIPLGGSSVTDTGFELFHRNAEAGISCASCHPGGTDDGHVWSFEGQGPRRTQPIDVRLEGTAPFHWDGSLPDVGELMGEVFVGRMGGVHQSPERREALERWLFALTPPAAEAPSDPGRQLRGRRLFESFEVGCADCHRGAALTDNNSYDVATGEPGEKFQVPSLLGLSSRSRFIHDGCARTLAERFAPDCGGGDRHGRVSQLDAAQLDDLIGYLETL